MDVPVFFIEPAGKQRVYLRRYVTGNCKHSYHNAMVFICEETGDDGASTRSHDRADPRWPTKCEHCDYEFQPTDEWQRFYRSVYRRADNGVEMTLDEAPTGACWNASWMAGDREEGFFIGADGRCLTVRTPRGDWTIDARASNCTMPDDNKHKCWVRHGKPEDGTLHVDKNGLTCAAGAGSIVIKDYHGFLHNGKLTAC